jgi:catechol 2,3-dioxygenase-like lactoylglutathione lyase family enzyme
MISGAHVIIYSKDAEADRAFFRDVLGFKSVDAGHGWLIFALPPEEAAFHPSENAVHELDFICNDLKAEMASLAQKMLSAPRSRKHDGVPLRRCGFPVEERSAFISRNILRPWA